MGSASKKLETDPNRDGQFQYDQVTATDCCQVVQALGEIDPFARLIVPGEFGGRDTFWITTIKVLSGPRPGNPNADDR